MPQAPRVTAVPPADHPVRPPCAEAFRRLPKGKLDLPSVKAILSSNFLKSKFRLRKKKAEGRILILLIF